MPSEVSKPRRKIAALALASAWILAACGEANGPEAPARAIPRPGGFYYVTSRDGQPMRLPLPDSAGWRRELATVRLAFVANSGVYGDQVYSVVVLTPLAGGAQTTRVREDGVQVTMLTPTSFHVHGLTYLAGVGTLEGDTTITLTSDSTALTGRHVWRLRKMETAAR